MVRGCMRGGCIARQAQQQGNPHVLHGPLLLIVHMLRSTSSNAVLACTPVHELAKLWMVWLYPSVAL